MKRRDALVIIAASWLAAIFAHLFLSNSDLAFVLAAALSATLLFGILRPRRLASSAAWCFAHRWPIALALFCACVGLRLHGSSIGYFDVILPTRTDSVDPVLFGVSRYMRSDEFAVQTLTHFSQAWNNYGLYSHQMSFGPTNMVLDYYSPVMDVTVLGKPLLWGYLLFGNEVGLSWCWCGQAILIFMCALEMCLVLSGGSRSCAVTGALMISLSPAIQWWFQPHMPIVILYSMALFDLGYAFCTCSGALRRWGLALLGSVTITGFCLSFFPSFQVPCAYIVVALLVACLVRDRERVSLDKRDLAPIATMLLVAGGIVGRFLVVSSDDLALVIGTDYPGQRVSLGNGWNLADTFTNLTSLFTPFHDATKTNNSETATYVHFAPFFLALLPRMLRRLRRREGECSALVDGSMPHPSPAGGTPTGDALVGQVFAVLLFVQLWYMLVGIPEPVAHATLLRYCARMNTVYGWTATLFSVWGLSVLMRMPDLLGPRERVAWPLAYVALYLLMADNDQMTYFAQFVVRGICLGPVFYVLAACVLGAILWLAARGRRHLVAGLVGAGMMLVGATVNPLVVGTSSITAHPISAQIQSIAAADPDACWLCCGDCPFTMCDFAMANGARVLDATNFYPDVEKWRIIDPSGTHHTQTNRYANQSLELVEGPSSVEVVYPDYIHVRLNPQGIRDLGVRYLLVGGDYKDLLLGHGISCEELFAQDGYTILRLHYEDEGGVHGSATRAS